MEKIFEINGVKYTFSAKEDVEIGFEFVGAKDGLSFYRVKFDWGKQVNPQQITLNYAIPAVDMYNTWDPIARQRHLGCRWGKMHTPSRLASGMPLRQILSRSGDNRYLISIEDVKSPLSIGTGASERSGEMEIEIDFFTLLTGPFATYETLIRIDERDIPFDEAIFSAREWYDELGYKNENIPALAKQPMYSTWYSLWQDVTAKQVLKECKQAVKMGMKTVIIDDGWQTAYSGEGYARVGDWKPALNKFGNLKTLVEKLHAIGMKVMVWYSVPYMGAYAKNCKKFKDMTLRYFEGTKCYALDPRYKEVRDFCIETYVNAVKEYDLDGLKLDFIDRFLSNGEIKEGMDFVSVEEATEQLLKDVNTALKAINPNILIEFRQPYFGPIVSTYGNMMRVWDCPLDGTTNRISSLDLRLVSGKCAVHSDMIYWHALNTAESVAVQLLGTMFSVPQISIKYDEIADVHKQVLKNYLDFWTAHASTLMDGKLSATLDGTGYGYATAIMNDEKISLAFANPQFEMTGEKDGYMFNITSSTSVILKADRDKYFYEVFDCTGGRVSRKARVKNNLTEVFVPLGGMLKVEKA